MVMKLGSGTGSLVNHVRSRMTSGQPEPKVGDGATLLHWSDREAATVTKVEPQKKGGWVIWVQEDDAKRTDSRGMCESQDYEYTPNPKGRVHFYRFEPNGKGWQEVTPGKRLNSWKLTGSGQGIRVGEREKYHDYSF